MSCQSLRFLRRGDSAVSALRLPSLCLDVGELEEKSVPKTVSIFTWKSLCGLVPPLVLWSQKRRGPQTAAALNNNLDGHLASPFRVQQPLLPPH